MRPRAQKVQNDRASTYQSESNSGKRKRPLDIPSEQSRPAKRRRQTTVTEHYDRNPSMPALEADQREIRAPRTKRIGGMDVQGLSDLCADELFKRLKNKWSEICPIYGCVSLPNDMMLLAMARFAPVRIPHLQVMDGFRLCSSSTKPC